jgi:predicted PurR-regulated permease PerM
MKYREHLKVAGIGLKRWFIAQCVNSLLVAGFWYIGLRIIGVPLALPWALLGGVLQVIPNFGMALALIGPAVSAAVSGGLGKLAYTLLLYVILAVADGFLFQPYVMKRTVRVPVWASIAAPILLGLVFGFWGVVSAGPLLAVYYALRAHRAARAEQ